MIQIIIGAQWGDEGKGKFVDLLAEKADYVVRFHGGNNAGHTIVNEKGKFPLHLVPAGICHPRAKCLVTNGVILDLGVLLEEIKLLNEAGIKTLGRLIISPRCHLIMPYHKMLDKLYEEAKGKGKTGTTGRGIGPTYADKVSYNGLRIFDLMNPPLFRQKLKTQLSIKNRIITALGGETLRWEEVLQEFSQYRPRVRPYVGETLSLLQKAVAKKENILFEGAHGFFLDNDWGTYPFCTASAIVPGSINSTCGLPIIPDKIVAVVKAYTTRVGGGPFPTELENKTGEEIRQKGNEFGTTTGRPRRCGWLDVELLRFSCQVCGATEIALTKLDILDELKEIKICVGYQYGSKKVNYLDGDAEFLGKVKPIYRTMEGWRKPIREVKKFEDLPQMAKEYINEISRLVGLPVAFVSVGPERNQTIKL